MENVPNKLQERIKFLQEQQSRIEALYAYLADLKGYGCKEEHKEVHARMLALVEDQIKADVQAIERQAGINTETTKQAPAKPQVQTIEAGFHDKWKHLLNQIVLAETKAGGKVAGKVIAIEHPIVKVSFENIGIVPLKPEVLTLKKD